MTRKSHNKQEALNALRDILSKHQIAQSPSKVIVADVLSLRERFKLTRCDWEYLRGYEDAIRQAWYRYNLVFCVQYGGWTYKMDWDTVPECVREHLRHEKEFGPLPMGHFWLNGDGSIGRPFSKSEQ